MKKSFLLLTISLIAIFGLLIVWMILVPKNNVTCDSLPNFPSNNEGYRATILDDFQKNQIKKVMHELEEIQSSQQINQQLVSEAIQQYGSTSIEVKNLSETKYVQEMIHLKKVTEIIDKNGWLGADKIGSQNNYTLFTTIQNADFETQDKYLGIMEQAIKSGSLLAEHFANLVDRKALAQHQHQIYGTQFISALKSGNHCRAPIIEETQVNKRRSEIGLPPLEAYEVAKRMHFPLLQKSI